MACHPVEMSRFAISQPFVFFRVFCYNLSMEKCVIIPLILLLIGCSGAPVREDFRKSGERFLTEPDSVSKHLPTAVARVKVENAFDPEDKSEYKPILKNEIPGLPKGCKRVYLSLFSDFTTNYWVPREFDRRLKIYLQDWGLQVVDKLNYAQAVIEGKISMFLITPADKITNLERGLMYLMKVDYSVWDAERKPVQQEKSIRMNILVTDKNKFLSNTVVMQIIDMSAKETANAVCFGWMGSMVSKKWDLILSEDENESDYTTNR